MADDNFNYSNNGPNAFGASNQGPIDYTTYPQNGYAAYPNAYQQGYGTSGYYNAQGQNAGQQPYGYAQQYAGANPNAQQYGQPGYQSGGFTGQSYAGNFQGTNQQPPQQNYGQQIPYSNVNGGYGYNTQQGYAPYGNPAGAAYAGSGYAQGYNAYAAQSQYGGVYNASPYAGGMSQPYVNPYSAGAAPQDIKERMDQAAENLGFARKKPKEKKSEELKLDSFITPTFNFSISQRIATLYSDARLYPEKLHKQKKLIDRVSRDAKDGRLSPVDLEKVKYINFKYDKQKKKVFKIILICCIVGALCITGIGVGIGVTAASVKTAEMQREYNIAIKNGTPGLGYVQASTDANALYVSKGDAQPLSGEVIIPEIHAGKRVIGISSNGFTNCSWLKCIVIPSSVTFIGKNAFVGSKIYDAYADGEIVYAGMIPEDSVIRKNGNIDLVKENIWAVGVKNGTKTDANPLSGQLLLQSQTVGIADSAFANTGITYATLGGGIKYVNGAAFENTGITAVEVMNVDKGQPTVFGEYIFGRNVNSNNVKISVAEDMFTTYYAQRSIRSYLSPIIGKDKIYVLLVEDNESVLQFLVVDPGKTLYEAIGNYRPERENADFICWYKKGDANKTPIDTQKEIAAQSIILKAWFQEK